MSLEYLFPIAKSHAIQSVIFAFEWQGDLSDCAFDKIKKLEPQLKKFFPVIATHSLLNIHIDGNGTSHNADNINIQQGSMSPIGAISFQRMGKFQNIISQITISRHNCVIFLSDYIRWDETLDAVLRYLKIVLPAILEEKSINVVALQYTDIFRWQDDPQNLKLNEVFNIDTLYLTKNVFSQKGIWHSHHGYMTDDFFHYGKCLDNINVNTIDNANDRDIHISTTHQVTLEKPLRLSTKNYLQDIENIQNSLHNHNKAILCDLLTEEVCKKIKLSI